MKTSPATRYYRRTKRQLLREVRLRRRQATRYARQQQRRAAREFRAWYKRQYFVATAYCELRRGIRQNEDIFLGSAIAGMILIYALASAGSQILFFSFDSMNGLSDLTGFSMGWLAIVCAGVLTTLTGWFIVLILNSLCLAIADGVQRRQNKSLRGTARRALAATSRVSAAWLLTMASLGAALALAATPLMLYIAAYPHTKPPVAFITADGVLMMVALYLGSSLLLAPHVALHEPKQTLPQTISRSYRLLQPRGRLFALGMAAGLAAALFGAWEVSTWMQQLLGYTGDIVFYLLALFEVVVAHLLLNMLYRKRKLARLAVTRQPLHLRWRRVQTPTPPTPATPPNL